MCEEMPQETAADKLAKGTDDENMAMSDAPTPAPARRLLDASSGYGGYGERNMGAYGATSRDAPRDPAARSRDVDGDAPATATTGAPTGSGTAAGFTVPESCDECLGIFEQCGAQGTTAACCEGAHSLVLIPCANSHVSRRACLFAEP